MNRLIKTLMGCLIILSLVACGGYGEGVNLSKDGTLYEISHEVSVYYPKHWYKVELDAKGVALSTYDANHLIYQDAGALQVDFYNENHEESFRFNRVSLSSDNTAEHLIQLFCEDLKLLGIQTSYTMGQLDNGVACYEVEGIHESKDQKYKWVIAYKGEKEYSYVYKANKQVYDQNIESMTSYLYSMEIQE